MFSQRTTPSSTTGDIDPLLCSALLAATANFPLGSLSSGIGFEPAGFRVTILFIEELP
ncbi:hypothetical protein [Sphingomonas sp. S2-65]|uniref:hypothetical protein n=1 Tax=Sphingomonas sp. S2-65 TaxID=2903960 RepID=UPI001F460480|nr:hypothetical protein [Sphingomonas sp. S2-65]UYY57193.1 hypothetical protein LZ586_10890 [Sphingomonas sp. S2-65]